MLYFFKTSLMRLKYCSLTSSQINYTLVNVCMLAPKADIIRVSPGGTTRLDEIELLCGNWVSFFASRATQFKPTLGATGEYDPLSSYQTIHVPSGQTTNLCTVTVCVCAYLSAAVVLVCSSPHRAGQHARGSRCCALSARGRRPNGPSGRPWPLRCQNWLLKFEISAKSAKIDAKAHQ